MIVDYIRLIILNIEFYICFKTKLYILKIELVEKK
jgi:hypothetical protein